MRRKLFEMDTVHRGQDKTDSAERPAHLVFPITTGNRRRRVETIAKVLLAGAIFNLSLKKAIQVDTRNPPRYLCAPVRLSMTTGLFLRSLTPAMSSSTWLTTAACGSDVHCRPHGSIGSHVNTSGKSLVKAHETSGTLHRVGHSGTSLTLDDRVAMERGFSSRRCARCKVG